ncbi:MAG TPA: DNA polymerase III subunit delta [bacterium]|nr:DNA polymerase III subunit delta [bacterium]
MDIKFTDEAKIYKSAKKPVYVLHGGYEFLQKEMAEKIINYLMPKEEQQTGLVRIDAAGDESIYEVINTANAPSLFSTDQVILVDNADLFTLVRREENKGKKNLSESEKYKNFKLFENFVGIATNPPKGIHLVFIYNSDLKKVTGRTASRSEKMIQKAYKEFEKNGVMISFPRMFDDDLVGWLMVRARKNGIQFTSEQAEMIRELGGADVRHLANEVEKLAAFSGDKSQLTSKEIKRLVSSCEDIYVFHAIDYMLKGEGRKALSMIQRAMDSGAAPVYIINVISGRLRQIWQARYLIDKGYFRNVSGLKYDKFAVINGIASVSDGDKSVLSIDKKNSIMSKTPFAVYHLLVPAKNLTLDEIEEALRISLDIDRRLKGIEKPRHGTDEIMIEKYIVDVSRNIRSAGVPMKQGSRSSYR